MELQQFEQLETKIVLLVAKVKKQKEENISFSLKIKELQNTLADLSEENDSLTAVKKKNELLRGEADRLKSERKWIGGKIRGVMNRIEQLEKELMR